MSADAFRDIDYALASISKASRDIAATLAKADRGNEVEEALHEFAIAVDVASARAAAIYGLAKHYPDTADVLLIAELENKLSGIESDIDDLRWEIENLEREARDLEDAIEKARA